MHTGNNQQKLFVADLKQICCCIPAPAGIFLYRSSMESLFTGVAFQITLDKVFDF